MHDFIANSGNNVISENHFGVNFIAGYNQTLPEGNFEQIIQDLNVEHIRYPGGTVTETYFDPNGSVWRELFEEDQPFATASDGRVIEGPGRMFELATRNDLEVTFVLPTDSLVSMVNGAPVVDEEAVEKVHQLVTDILDGRFGEVTIDSFEVGNEYYHHPDMTAEEYSAIANEVIIAVDDAIQNHAASQDLPENWVAPDIAVQAGAGWLDGDNEAIIEGLSDSALEAVTSVVTHFYSADLDAVGLRDEHLGQINEWEQATGIDDLKYHISEWNVAHGDTGMAQSSTIITAFDEMLSHGVDSSSIWGAQLRWLESGLSVNLGDDDLELAQSRLSVSGEMIASMSESLVGLRSIDVEAHEFLNLSTHDLNRLENGELQIEVFGDEDRAVFYISSRSDTQQYLNLDLDGYFGDYNHVWGETLTSRDDPDTGWRDETDPTSAYGVADFTTINSAVFDGSIGLWLEPYEIARISVQLSDEGVFMDDHSSNVVRGLDYNDSLVGSDYGDTIITSNGNDRVLGKGGEDMLRAGEDDDDIWGGTGNDAAFGGSGDDVIKGESGDDWIVGGVGDDHLEGNEGADIISGNIGDDTLFGGGGDDILAGGAGENVVAGGAGADYFIVTSDEHLIIEDFNVDQGDRITFLGQFEDRQSLVEQITTTEPTDGEAGDLIVSGVDGSRTILIGAANDYDAVIDSVVDFTPEGKASLDLADQLNQLDPIEVGPFLDGLDSESYLETVGSTDGIILFANLEADTAGAFLNSLNIEEMEDLLGGMGDDGLKLALGEMTPEEILVFLDAVNLEVAPGLVGALGENTVLGALTELDDVSQNQVHDKFFPPEEQDLGPLSGNGDSSATVPDLTPSTVPTIDEIIPQTNYPPEDEEEDEEEEDSLESSVFADCFIATVAYENGEHPDVWLLRWFRDAVLRNSLVGRAAIVIYWHLGPKLAEWISNKPQTKQFIRGTLEAIVSGISWFYGRPVGKQPDQLNLSDSRHIKLRS